MKKLSIGLTVGLLALAFSAMGADAKLSFKVIGGSQSGVYCYQLKNGQPVSLGFQRPDANGEGAFELDIDQPTIYYIKKAGGKGSVFQTVVLLKPSEQKKLQLSLDESGIDFAPARINQPGVETEQLQQWLEMFNKVGAAVAANDGHKLLFRLYPELVRRAATLKNGAQGDKSFKDAFAAMIDADLLYLRAAAFFYGNDRLNYKYDSSNAVAEFYRPLSNLDACLGGTGLLGSVYGVDLIRYVLAYNVFMKTDSQDSVVNAGIRASISAVPNDTLKGIYAVSFVPAVTNYEGLISEIGPFERYFYANDLKEVYLKRKRELSRFAMGKKAYNFKLKDVNSGKVLQLSDFRGKVVVADLWAMWCAPCLAERPRFMEIEHSYKNRNDIVFLGISVDGLNREGILKAFLKKKNWNGIELESNYDESVMKYYGVLGIPRFMIFDRAGNVFNVDAPRPSQPGFEKQVKQALDGKR